MATVALHREIQTSPEVDFGKFNLMYITQMREVAMQDEAYAASIFGISVALASDLASLSIEEVARFGDIKTPLPALSLNQLGITRIIEAIHHDSDEVFSNAVNHIKMTNASA